MFQTKLRITNENNNGWRWFCWFLILVGSFLSYQLIKSIYSIMPLIGKQSEYWVTSLSFIFSFVAFRILIVLSKLLFFDGELLI